MSSDDQKHAFATRAIHAGQEPDPSTGAIMPPIYATSTYVQESPGVHRGYEYSRTQNPTRMAYERCVANLESGTHGFAFASGMAAIGTALELVDSGSHIVAMDDLYGGTRRLFSGVRERSAGLEFTYVDMSDANTVADALRENTRMVWIESPSNPLLKLVDLKAVTGIVSDREILVVCDNTFATPYNAAFSGELRVPVLALHSESDGIVGPGIARCDGDPAYVTNMVIVASHVGFPFNPLVFAVIANHLVEPGRRWAICGSERLKSLSDE